MKNKFLYSHNLLMIVQILIFFCISYNRVTSSPTSSNTFGYIKSSCATTLYPSFCYESLSRYEAIVNSNPRTLALTALSVAFNSTSSALKLLKNIERSHPGWSKPGEVASLLECVEVVGDSVFELQRSLSRLNHTESGYNFVVQMDDVQTWVSAALTDDDTCIDDFIVNGNMKIVVRGLILKIARLASVALAFINKYAGV